MRHIHVNYPAKRPKVKSSFFYLLSISILFFSFSACRHMEHSTNVESKLDITARDLPPCKFNSTMTGEISLSSQSIEKDNGLIGTFIFPSECLPQKAVMMIGGSEGGIPSGAAREIAKWGYGVLAIAYFQGIVGSDLMSLPKDLNQIPLEFIDRGIQWIKLLKFPSVSLVAASKGSEATLAYLHHKGQHLIDIDKAVLITPPSHAFEGLTTVITPYGPQNRNSGRSAWKYRGASLPYLSMQPRNWSPEDPRKIALKDLYEKTLQAPNQDPNAEFQIKGFKRRLLFLSGMNDQLWPTAQMVSQLESNPLMHEKVVYEDAGHSLLSAHEDDGSIVLVLGKTTEKTAQRVKEKIRAFLQD